MSETKDINELIEVAKDNIKLMNECKKLLKEIKDLNDAIDGKINEKTKDRINKRKINKK